MEIYFYLTDRFHFAVVCSVIDAQMTSQRGKNKKVAHETKSTTLWRPLCIYNWTDNGEMESICFTWKKKYISKNLLNFPGEISGIKKSESRHLTWSMIYTNQATSLARDIAVRSVIGLHKSDHIIDVICASVL